MASYVDMSLEDIIQKKKQKNRPNKLGNAKVKHQSIPRKPAITDARNKIISKKRIQIKDAREKLAELAKQRDARVKLNQLREKKIGLVISSGRIFGTQNAPEFRGKRMRTIPSKEIVFTDHTRQVKSQPHQTNLRAKLQSNRKKFMEGRSFGSRDYDPIQRLKPIVRTVENDIVVLDEDDPMEEYPPLKMTSINRKANFNLKIIARNDKADFKSSVNIRRTEREKSPQRLPSILKKRPMAAMRSDRKERLEEVPPTVEYRIIVSNLKSSVTSGDIQELFGDVGALLESRLVRPGTAEVIYKNQEDAQRAVDLYHNRQLDGQAMNCLLVIPRNSAAQSSRSNSSSKPSLPPSTSSNVEPDLSTFHKVLFNDF